MASAPHRARCISVAAESVAVDSADAGSGSRKALLGSGGGTKQSERAVAAALDWLARHQLSNGSWGLASYKSRCRDATCSGPGKAGERPAAATALALLPFLADGQTHESRGPYKKTIAAGIRFLISKQLRNGELHSAATCTITAWPPSRCASVTA